jgi:hypothetical protein
MVIGSCARRESYAKHERRSLKTAAVPGARGQELTLYRNVLNIALAGVRSIGS